jgi:hypothetical protein
MDNLQFFNRDHPICLTMRATFARCRSTRLSLGIELVLTLMCLAAAGMGARLGSHL